LELTAYVETELEQNPLLERGEGDGSGEGPGETPAESPGESLYEDGGDGEREIGGDGAAPEGVERAASDTLPGADEQPLDADSSNLDDQGGPSDGFDAAGDSLYWSGGGGSGEEGDSSWEQRLVGDVTLRQHLLQQLHMELSDPADRLIG